LEDLGIKTRYAVCSVGGPEVAIRCFRFPALPAEEIEQAVLMEADQVCPFGIDRSTVDYELLDQRNWLGGVKRVKPSKDDEEICGVMVSATNRVIQARKELVKNASLKCVLMDVDSLALLNCFMEYDKPQPGQSIVILNIGSSYTNLIIVPHEGLPCMRVLPYATAEIVEQMAIEYGVTPRVIEEYLQDSEDGADNQESIAPSMEKACQKLISDVTETIRYYRVQEKIPAVEKILVCGGFSLAKGFVELLDLHLPGKAVLWNPFERIRYNSHIPGQEIIEKYGPALTVATGLAMRSI
jgi:type IV pilus assembly protein PilM